MILGHPFQLGILVRELEPAVELLQPLAGATERMAAAGCPLPLDGSWHVGEALQL